MATEAGTDVQFNLLSLAATGCAVGGGGPNAVSLPFSVFPANRVIDPTDLRFLIPLSGNPADPSKYDAILKADNGFGSSCPPLPGSDIPGDLSGLWVAQGYQDSLNMANGVSGVVVSGDLGVTMNPGLRVITDKGNPGIIEYGRIFLHHHGTDTDIDLGNWLDESMAATGRRDLTSVAMTDGSRVRVTVGHAKWPKVGPGQRILIGASIKSKIYWWTKRGVRWAMRIPLGQPGPSWLV